MRRTGNTESIRIFCNETPTRESYDHHWTYELLKQENAIEIMPLDKFQSVLYAQTNNYNLLGLSHAIPYEEGALERFFEVKKEKFTILYESAYGTPLQRTKAQLETIIKHPQLKRASGVLYCGDPISTDFFSLLFKKRNIPLCPSTDFIFSTEKYKKLFTLQNTNAPRKHRFFFAGGGGGRRKIIFRALEPLLNRRDFVEINERITNEVFVEMLQNSEFSLCLPGWVPWTHRLVESVLLGAVPIVGRKAFAFIADTVPRDAVILVQEDYSPSAWEKAVKSAAGLHPEKIRFMQKKLLLFRNKIWTEEGFEKWVNRRLVLTN
jgi:hypothetical protein